MVLVMKIVKKKDANKYGARELIEYFGSDYIQRLARKIKSPNDLTDKVVKILVKDCCECGHSHYKIHILAEQLRLYNKLTDDNIKIMIKGCLAWYIPELAEQIRLADKLTDDVIELMIDKCDYREIPRLVPQIPDNYKPTKAVIELLEVKGYKVL